MFLELLIAAMKDAAPTFRVSPGSRTRVKICGLTREQDVDAAVDAGADAVGFVLYIAALSGGQLSIVYPVFASSFIFVTLISAAILKEKITAIRAVGVLLVFIGIGIVAIS